MQAGRNQQATGFRPALWSRRFRGSSQPESQAVPRQSEGGEQQLAESPALDADDATAALLGRFLATAKSSKRRALGTWTAC